MSLPWRQQDPPRAIILIIVPAPRIPYFQNYVRRYSDCAISPDAPLLQI
jgi:hypothetical protein